MLVSKISGPLFSIVLLGLLGLLQGVQSLITSITPTGVIEAGGIVMTVTGTDLNPGTTPKIVITATYTPSSGVATTKQYTGADCSSVTATSLVCTSPEIDLTDIEAAGYTVPQDNATRLLNLNLVDESLDFTVGVTWSDASNVEDYSSINVYKNPYITMRDSERTFTIWTNRIIRLFGFELDSYVTNMSDYTITIANLNCPVDYLNKTWMSCEIPTTIPTPDDGEKSIVTLFVGGYSAQVGRIHYRVPIFDEKTGPNDAALTFDPSNFANRVTATGNFLVVGLTNDSYYVQIGQGECSHIVLSPYELKCRPPETAPVPLVDYPLRGELPQMVITVPRDSSAASFQYVYHVAYINYGADTNPSVNPPFVNQVTVTTTDSNASAASSDDNWKWIVVGVCAFVGVIFIATLLCCLCCGDLLGIGRRRFPLVEKNPSFKVDRESTSSRTHRSSIRSYQTRTTANSSSMYPTPSQLYYITEQRYGR